MNIAKFALVALLLSAGCAKRGPGLPFTPRDVPEARDEKGWPLYEQAGDGFAVALPPDWVAADLTPEALNRTLNEGLKANPELQAMQQNIRQQVTAGMKFIGFEQAGIGSGLPMPTSSRCP